MTGNVPDPEECAARLAAIFPRDGFDSVLSNPLAALAVFTFLYSSAVADSDTDPNEQRWVRPSMVLWMTDAAITRRDKESREAWAAAALDRTRLARLHESWGEPFTPRYNDNSRETLRDETFKLWMENGALVERTGIATTSSKPRYALSREFADLFDTELDGEDMAAAITEWQERFMTPGAKARALFAAERARQLHEVVIRLPTGRERSLEPGDASLILKGVIETWAPARLRSPAVLAISEPGQKVLTDDEALLSRLGLHLDASRLLPDALLVDLDEEPVSFWIVEAVASDGPVDEERRSLLLEWAESQGIVRANCFFLSAFVSRSSAPARRRLKDLAIGTYAWYADEPTIEIAVYRLP